eukprot:gene4044-20217_t
MNDIFVYHEGKSKGLSGPILYPNDFSNEEKRALRRYANKYEFEEAEQIFKEFHDSPFGGHSGFNNTAEQICSRYKWKGITTHLNKEFYQILGVNHKMTAAYHPQTNGLDERTNQNIKRRLEKLFSEEESLDHWDELIDPILFSIRTTKSSTTKFSPFQLMYGREALRPIETTEIVSDLSEKRKQLPLEDAIVAFINKINDVKGKKDEIAKKTSRFHKRSKKSTTEKEDFLMERRPLHFLLVKRCCCSLLVKPPAKETSLPRNGQDRMHFGDCWIKACLP